MHILKTIAKAGHTVEQAAVNMAGNYKKWQNYAFFGTKIPRYDTLMIGCIVSHQYTLRELTNLEALTQALKPYLGDPYEGATAYIYKQDFCGDKDLLTEMMIQVYDENNQITPAFHTVFKLAKQLEKDDDGIIDHNIFKQVNRRQLLQYVNGELPYICKEHHIHYEEKLLTNVVNIIEEEEINFDEIEEKDIINALKELNYLDTPETNEET